MLTSKYHISTIISIFFALGIGILIGGTLGQTWMVQTENRIVDMLMVRYENQIAMNQLLQKQMSSLQLMNQNEEPILHHQKIMWIRPDRDHNELLQFVMKSAGAEWIEQNVEVEVNLNAMLSSSTTPDILLISDPAIIQQVPAQFQPKVIDIHPKFLKFNEPQEALDFIYYLKKITEEAPYATFGIHRYSGLE